LNTLYYGDNLTVLKNAIDDESVDPIYLDPPFNSRQDYNVLFRGTSGEQSQAQIQAFDDTWHWVVSMVRDLGHVVDREKAKIGVFITLAEPTGPMKTEAVKAGYYETLYGKYPKLQILTIADLFAGKQPNIPLVDSSSFKKASRESTAEQNKLLF